MLAYLIKDTAPKNGDLDICLDELSHVAEDGYLDIRDVGLEGIKERMRADFGPKTHLMADQARRNYENTRRKFKERPKWFFRRLERAEGLMNKIDPEHKVSSNFKANLIFHNSGLERREREKVFKEAERKWDYDLFKKIILDRYELKHEMDVTMVNRAFKNRNRPDAHKTYVAFDPESPDMPGTDLFREDCDEECLDDVVDTTHGFTPANPVLLAQGEFFNENPGFEESYQELEVHDCLWLNAYGQDCDLKDSEPNTDNETYIRRV